MNSVNPELSRELVLQKLGNDGLRRVYKKLGVVVVYLYGGYARGEPTKFSDIDVGVILDKRVPREKYLDITLELMDEISRFLRFPDVDVRVLNEAPVVFRFGVVRDGCLAFCSDESLRVEFEAGTMMEYFDFKYVLDEYHRHLVKRIEEGRMTD
ncbi:MAG: type VII toxin-antitoxin system MntA family adenylyltransferase antitoxin [Candidatus Freyarchaeota archaeon]